MEPSTTIIRKPCSGTLEYMAPELLRNRDYDYTVDLWSMGVLLYEMLHGSSPFKGNTDADTMGNILQCNIKYRPGISIEAKSIISSLLQKDPQQRLKWNEVFYHKWVLKFSQQVNSTMLPFNENDFEEFSTNDFNSTSVIRLPFNGPSSKGNPGNKKTSSSKLGSNSTVISNITLLEPKRTNVGFKSQSKIYINNERYKRSQFTPLSDESFQSKSLESSLCMVNQKKANKTPLRSKPFSIWEKIKSYVYN
jgi:serine/threonine protein kinase